MARLQTIDPKIADNLLSVSSPPYRLRCFNKYGMLSVLVNRFDRLILFYHDVYERHFVFPTGEDSANLQKNCEFNSSTA